MIRWEREHRITFFNGWTPGLILGVFFYLVFVAGFYAISHFSDHSVTPCLFLRVTDHPCPLCGGTRALFQLGSGNPLGALALNPFVSVAVPLVAIWIGLRVIAGLRLRFIANRGWVWGSLVLLVIANWIYVLVRWEG